MLIKPGKLAYHHLTPNPSRGSMSAIEILQPFYLGKCLSRGEGYLGGVT